MAPERMMAPLESIEADPPNAWITYFDGFAPQRFGFVGFTLEDHRKSFLKRSDAGVLVVVAGTYRAAVEERRRIIGILQCSHEAGPASDFMPPDAIVQELTKTPSGRWGLAVCAVRAWSVLPHSRMPIGKFASETYTPQRAQKIGSAGMKLTASEACRILDLDLMEVDVYGQPPIGLTEPGPARAALTPSRPGPVSQVSSVHPEAEGPKHLYVLALSGKPSTFLNDPTARGRIVKVGFSKAPGERCAAFNAHLPVGQFQWCLHRSTEAEGCRPLPGSVQALAGEDAMKRRLSADGRSLGREFFLAEDGAIEGAWRAAIEAADAP